MKSPYPEELDNALKSISPCQVEIEDYAQILKQPELTADFVRQRVASKRKWYEENQNMRGTRANESWQDRIIRVVYEGNLGIKVHQDGKMIYSHGSLLIIDWQSWCPVLTYCTHKGQPTVPICSVLYHMQFQYLLSLVLPGALFTRDYSRIRPDSCHCREIIFYKQEEVKKVP